MPAKKRKTDIITFKAEASLLQAIKAVPNRSAFIRAAVLAALDSTCPVCGGTGVLSTNQMRHWEAFAEDHALEECRRCHEVRVVCSKGTRRKAGRPGKRTC